jgi:diacylglycerol kinase (ATP)
MAAYLSAVIKTIFRYKHPRVKISWDAQELNKTVLLINTGIGQCSGGGFYLTPDAILDDGLFDVCIIDTINKLRIMKELPKALDGSHTKLKEVRMLRTEGLKITSDQGLPVHADGEMLSMNARSIGLSMASEKVTVIRGS